MAISTHTCKWPSGIYQWVSAPGEMSISVPFTWCLPEVRAIVEQRSLFVESFRVGGPAVALMPSFFGDFPDYVSIGGDEPGLLQKINSAATRTTMGCPRRCAFCGVGRGLLEPGGFRELDDWFDAPIVVDNNLLACSRKHFDRVIDRLKRHDYADFNQGLDARLLTQHHAGRFAELSRPTLRLAWDSVGNEKHFMRAVGLLRAAGIPASRISVYVLIGFHDTPEDALYRLQAIRDMGCVTAPMRYRPLDCLEKDYVMPGTEWTDRELKRFMQYFYCARLRKIPFDVYELGYKRPSDRRLF